MAAVVPWLALQQWVDYIVDGRWSETVMMFPWADGTGVYVPGEQGPDPTRKVLVSTAVLVTPGAALVGESGRATGGVGGGFDTRLLEAETWMSITTDKLISVTNWRESDRVYFPPPRDEWYNISYLDPSATRRPNIHLIREHDITAGTSIPLGLITPSQLNALYFNMTNMAFYRAVGTTDNDWVRL